MLSIPVIAIFDVGKTNKKLLLFDEQYKVVYELSHPLKETTDEDGFACENVELLTQWLKESFQSIVSDKRFNIKAVNFSAYGASFVYLDKKENVIAPLYNYLKPYPPILQKKFYDTYGGESLVAKETASPVLGNLNSGMQLYRLKYERPELFSQIKYALHLPQYLSYVICGSVNTDISSIGCHTNLWNFQEKNYHSWVLQENLLDKFPAIKHDAETININGNNILVGAGLHDSSAALIPYLSSFEEPFVLLSTGTWCISLNPFNQHPLTDDELKQDCLCYLSYEGKPVKAARLFAGYEHEQQVNRLCAYFKVEPGWLQKCKPDIGLLKKMKSQIESAGNIPGGRIPGPSKFGERSLNIFSSSEEAYHQLITDIMEQQIISLQLVLKEAAVKRIFVDGGFSHNLIYMRLLASAFPDMGVFAASVPQASALGAALVISGKREMTNLFNEMNALQKYTPLF
jgi:sugar (pentulose or hexulose) kinase